MDSEETKNKQNLCVGEGGDVVGKNGEKLIFLPKYIFFYFCKDRNSKIWVKFGPIWTKNRNRQFFQLQRLDFVQTIRKS